jgi:alpha-L-rhamnosidase
MATKNNICLLKSHWYNITLVILFIAIGGVRAMNVIQLKCDYKTNPLGIDAKNPRLSWILGSEKRGEVQTSYQILVASEIDILSESSADMWNSGKLNSRQSVHVVYSGKVLKSRQRYFWKIRIWDKDGQPSQWSEIAWWEMALLNRSDWQASWISDGKTISESDEELYKEDPAPLYRKEFFLQKRIKSARLYITGLGYYESFINGKRIGRNVLDPGWTNYSKRIYYSIYDVTEHLLSGLNCMGVTLGNGWYNPLPLRMWGHLNLREHFPMGRPRFIAQMQITYTDGSEELITSDQSWKYTEGPVLKNNIYLGEVYDARREIKDWSRVGVDEENWHPAKIVKENVGQLQAQPVQPIRITGELKVKNITQPSQGVYIIDMGQNFAGWASFRFNTPRGTEIQLRYGELLYEDGTLNPMTSVCGQIKGTRKDKNGMEYNTGGPGSPEIAWQADTYTAKGGGWEEYRPRFTFHAFRYIEITGYPGEFTPDMVTGLRLNSDVDETGTFSCSNQMFNDIQNMSQWTFLSNLFSVQSDCPHRERFGYGGDLVGTNEAIMMNYDMSSFYTKAVQDWADAAREDGMFTDTAPFVGIQYCGIGWAMIHPMLQLNLYKYYGNRSIIEEQYNSSRRWMELLINKYPEYIVNDGLSDHESINDTPAEQLVTPLYYHSAKMLARMAKILNRSSEEEQYDQLSENIKRAYLEKFFDKESGIIDPGTQTSQSFGLYLGLVPVENKEAALNYLVQNIVEKNQGHLSTGLMGTPFMLDVLCRNDREDIAYEIVNKRTFPGWGFMLKNDATTVWEHWEFSDNTYSHNHPMFGSVSQWFFNWLGGIQPAPDAVGFDKIILRPQIIEDLQWVETTYNSVRGKIASNWSKNDDNIMLEISIPVNAQAELYLPVREGDRVLESGMPITQAAGVDIVSQEQIEHIYKLGSGNFNFEIKGKK